MQIVKFLLVLSFLFTSSAYSAQIWEGIFETKAGVYKCCGYTLVHGTMKLIINDTKTDGAHLQLAYDAFYKWGQTMSTTVDIPILNKETEAKDIKISFRNGKQHVVLQAADFKYNKYVSGLYKIYKIKDLEIGVPEDVGYFELHLKDDNSSYNSAWEGAFKSQQNVSFCGFGYPSIYGFIKLAFNNLNPEEADIEMTYNSWYRWGQIDKAPAKIISKANAERTDLTFKTERFRVDIYLNKFERGEPITGTYYVYDENEYIYRRHGRVAFDHGYLTLNKKKSARS